ncbi:MAG: T9SS type A sorting domain-containing protein [Ignavibacteriales bacterium]|nr:T9SS type A sorting domain-containing protein [Ignavibacteriales bacterium]
MEYSSATEDEGPSDDMVRLKAFNKWMTDTLQAGLDSYGAFPPNVKIFDFFNLLKSPNSNYMDPIYRDSPTDYHPNALASSLVAPILVQQMFDAAIAYEGIVPVELTSFTGDYEDGVVKLKWITATETNNSGFEVERRNDYSAYESIGFVNGNGTSTNRVTYNFVDDNLSSNRYYYRLKQIDLDGTFDYSNEVQIEIDALMNYQLYQNYPNPFNPSTEIYFTLAKSGNVSLKVFNSLGSVVATLIDGYMESGKHSIKYITKDSSSGIYFYKLKADNFTSTRKMLFIK